MTPESQQERAIPPDLYGAEEGDCAWYPGGTRNQARAVGASWFGDYPSIRAYRVHLRHMTDEERDAHGFGESYGVCVIECPADHPEAVASWRLEADS